MEIKNINYIIFKETAHFTLKNMQFKIDDITAMFNIPKTLQKIFCISNLKSNTIPLSYFYYNR